MATHLAAMASRWQYCVRLVRSRFEPQTSCSRDARVTARPTGRWATEYETENQLPSLDVLNSYRKKKLVTAFADCYFTFFLWEL